MHERETIMDNYGRTIGTIEVDTTGRTIAKDFYGRTVGRYDPDLCEGGATTDFYGNRVSYGNTVHRMIPSWEDQMQIPESACPQTAAPVKNTISNTVPAERKSSVIPPSDKEMADYQSAIRQQFREVQFEKERKQQAETSEALGHAARAWCLLTGQTGIVFLCWGVLMVVTCLFMPYLLIIVAIWSACTSDNDMNFAAWLFFMLFMPVVNGIYLLKSK